jgi:hypothetical protein
MKNRVDFLAMCEAMAAELYDRHIAMGSVGQMRISYLQDGNPPEKTQNMIWRIEAEK